MSQLIAISDHNPHLSSRSHQRSMWHRGHNGALHGRIDDRSVSEILSSIPSPGGLAPGRHWDDDGCGYSLQRALYGYDSERKLAVVGYKKAERGSPGSYLNRSSRYELVQLVDTGTTLSRPVSANTILTAARRKFSPSELVSAAVYAVQKPPQRRKIKAVPAVRLVAPPVVHIVAPEPTRPVHPRTFLSRLFHRAAA